MLKSSFSKIKNFLIFQKNNISRCNNNNKHVTICIGNEAADADSIISTLCYAYYKHIQQNKDVDIDRDKNTDNVTNYFPIVCVRRDEIHLRRDVEILLQEIGVELSDLISYDEFPFDTTYLNKNYNIILIDHNALSTKVMNNNVAGEDIGDKIVEIIDHHIDLDKYPTCEGIYLFFYLFIYLCIYLFIYLC
jgi:exopolyphosphatase